MEAMREEWQGPVGQGVSITRIVAREARQKGKYGDMARARGLVVERRRQLKERDPWRKFQGCG